MSKFVIDYDKFNKFVDKQLDHFSDALQEGKADWCSDIKDPRVKQKAESLSQFIDDLGELRKDALIIIR